jgi:hypothetical protein
MAFNVGDSVVCQKMGGNSGTKPITPAFPGVVKEVLGGGKYRVAMRVVVQASPAAYFGEAGIVDEADMTSA